MSTENQRRTCKRITKQGVPCRNKSRRGSDYCFSHKDLAEASGQTLSQKQGWGHYVGIAGSLASVIGLIIIFFPGPTSHSPEPAPSASTNESSSATPNRIGQEQCTAKATAEIVSQDGDYVNYEAALHFRLVIENHETTMLALNSIKINLDGTTVWDDRVSLKVPGETNVHPNPFSFCIEPTKGRTLDVYYTKAAKRPEQQRFSIRVGFLDSNASPKCVYATSSKRP